MVGGGGFILFRGKYLALKIKKNVLKLKCKKKHSGPKKYNYLALKEDKNDILTLPEKKINFGSARGEQNSDQPKN